MKDAMNAACAFYKAVSAICCVPNRLYHLKSQDTINFDPVTMILFTDRFGPSPTLASLNVLAFVQNTLPSHLYGTQHSLFASRLCLDKSILLSHPPV